LDISLWEFRKSVCIPGRNLHSSAMATQMSPTTLNGAEKDLLSFTIRIATTADAASIKYIGSTVFTATFGHSLSKVDLDAYLGDAYSLQSVLDDIVNSRKTVCVAYDAQDRVLGFALLTEGTVEGCVRGMPAPIELQRLYVDTTAHGKGVGGALLRHVEGLARRKGFRTLWLGVWEHNHRAQAVYKKLGYGKVGVHDFVMGNERQTDEIWTKSV